MSSPDWIELTSKDGTTKWLIRVANISFVRKKAGGGEEAAILLVSGGTLEPSDSYKNICTKLAGGMTS